MDDLVKQLRDGARRMELRVNLRVPSLLTDAADRIEALEADRARLEAIAMAWGWLAIEGRSVMCWGPDDWRIEVDSHSAVVHDMGFENPYEAVLDAIKRQMDDAAMKQPD